MTVSSESYHSTHIGCIHPKWSYWRQGHHNATYPQFIQDFAPTDVQGPTWSRLLIFVLSAEQIPLSHLERFDLDQLHDLSDLDFPAC